jgi:hypothetical protein
MSLWSGAWLNIWTHYLNKCKMCIWITLMPKTWPDISDYLGDQSRFQAMIWSILNQGSQALKQLCDDRNGILPHKCQTERLV